ncbi:MAG: hypothetical protein EOM25_06000 [Deltaproteobacteria bacterium]|nr:hypothetical protein [Deltaproteobacteria bacterium]
MKRGFFAILAFVMALASGQHSGATELRARGEFKTQFSWWHNAAPGGPDFSDETRETFTAMQRIRMWFDFVVSENLKATYAAEASTFHWGDPAAGMATGGRSANVKTLEAYVDFRVPGLSDAGLRVGLQPFVVPGNLGSHVFDDRATAILATIPAGDHLGLTGGWARPYNGCPNEPETSEALDLALLFLPVHVDGLEVTPYYIHAFVGDDLPSVRKLSANPGVPEAPVTGNAKAWWAGASARAAIFDPLVVMADFTYGRFSQDRDPATGLEKIQGWVMDLAVDYVLESMTPEVFLLYQSGDTDKSDGVVGVMPALFPDVAATTFLYDGSALLDGGGNGGVWEVSPLWAVGGKIKNLTLVPSLCHTLTLMYARGTSDTDCGQTFHRKDSLWEADLDTRYAIFEELAAVAELGYIKPSYDDRESKAAYRLSLGLAYTF